MSAPILTLDDGDGNSLDVYADGETFTLVTVGGPTAADDAAAIVLTREQVAQLGALS